MSQAATIADKVRAWAKATEAKADPLLACLECLRQKTPDAIASDVLERQVEIADPLPASAAVIATPMSFDRFAEATAPELF